jgi:hypothetical protein
MMVIIEALWKEKPRYAWFWHRIPRVNTGVHSKENSR